MPVYRPILNLLAACAASVALYLFLVFVVLHKPLTTGTVLALTARRDAYVASNPGPKIIVIAGSNGLYSFRCEVISEIVHRPCVNLSIGAQAGLNYDLLRVERIMRTGDVVVMPYEFEVYKKPDSMLYGGLSSQLMVQYDRATLWHQPPARIVDAVFAFDFRFALESVTEILFSTFGVKGYFTADAFTPEGDYAIGDARMAARYADKLREEPMVTPADDVLLHPSGAQTIMKRFFAAARAGGVTVFGSLPTTFNDRPHHPAPIARLEHFYTDNGAGFLVLSNQNQYPRSCFLDSYYHLNETCQIAHSRAFGALLATRLTPLPGSAAP